MAPSERLVGGCHDGGISTVGKQGDGTPIGIANQAKLVPGVLSPVKSIGPVTVDSDAGFIVNQETTVGMVIWLGGDVAVIEMGTVLEVVKEAHVPVSVVLASLQQVAFQDEISQAKRPQQANVVRGANLVFVVAWSKLFHKVTPVLCSQAPGCGVTKLKIVQGIRFPEVL